MERHIKIVIKIIISVVLFVAISSIMKYYQPAIGGSIAVSQLEDSYSSSAGVKMWQDFKDNWIIGYGLIVIVLFSTDLVRLFKRKY